MLRRAWAPVLVITCLAGLLITTNTALAEGSLQLGVEHGLSEETLLQIDIVDETTETIGFTGTGTLNIFAPGADVGADAPLAMLTIGMSYTPTEAGRFLATLSAPQPVAVPWDINVSTSAEVTGRVSSPRWRFLSSSGAVIDASDGSLYVSVPGGTDGEFGVIEVRHRGYAGGLSWEVIASAAGIGGVGRAVSPAPSTAPDFDVFISVPSASTLGVTAPVLSEVSAGAGALGCSLVAAGATTMTFEFTSNVVGSAHLLCDTSGDGEFDRANPADAFVRMDAVVGTNTLEWDGRDAAGALYPLGDVDCQLSLVVGEMHYVSNDIETSFEGLRMFDATEVLRTGRPMFWDDSAVQLAAVAMPNTETSPERSPLAGVDSGDSGDATAPQSTITNGNARAWGNFSGASKGDGAALDTHTYLTIDRSAVFTITLVDPMADGDTDMITDYLETCELCSDPTLADTDDDGIDDFVETDGGTLSVNSDTDLLCDAVDTDSDDDCVLDRDDGVDDTDEDMIPDWRDSDNDGDTILGCVEVADAAMHGLNIDGDDIPAYDDTDSDGDGKDDSVELRGDIDMDGIPNYLDPNDCSDGAVDADEACDDGNLDPGDGCSATCAEEPGFVCTGVPSTCATACGDGLVAGDEVCDDGMLSDTMPDACRTDCTAARCGDSVVDTGESCDAGAMNSTDPGAPCRPGCLTAGCGDGIRDPGETCDEGMANSDTLANACRTSCRPAFCGDDVLDSGELCDEGSMNSDSVADACRTSCVPAFCGDSVTDTGEDCDEGDDNSSEPDATCRPGCEAPGCGDGIIDTGEECDEGEDNSDSESGACRTSCETPSCGDGVVDPGEGCDEGEDNSDDPRATCRSNCAPSGCGDGVVQAGETCDEGERNSDAPNAACRTTCVLASCGDGILDTARENCDDGGANSDTAPDRCRRSCEPASCGDDVIDMGEECDDGEVTPTCSAMCMERELPDGGVDAGMDAGGDVGVDAADVSRGGPTGGSCAVGLGGGLGGSSGGALVICFVAGLVWRRRSRSSRSRRE